MPHTVRENSYDKVVREFNDGILIRVLQTLIKVHNEIF